MPSADLEQPARPSLLTRLVVGGWLAYWGLLATVMHLPKVPAPRVALRLGDKVLHCAVYLVLALLGGWAAMRLGRRLDARWVVRWGLIYAAYAAADELLQPLSGRTCQLGDWLADVIGIVAALVLVTLLARPRSDHR